MRPKYDALDALTETQTKVLDHGFVRLVDYMGDDSAIVQAARVSYGKGTRTVSEDRSLIRRLMREKHSTPFEMCEIKLHIKVPIFIARQWIRYRTANVNEYSGRFSEMPNEFYFPELERFTGQSQTNKQGSSDKLIEDAAYRRQIQKDYSDDDFRIYEESLKAGLNREIARIGLPLSTYTMMYWKNDLHNLLHFLEQRLKENAQPEIRAYAEAIANIVKLWVPHAWEAFVDYRLEAVTFSRMEMIALRELIAVYQDPEMLYTKLEGFVNEEKMKEAGMSKREIKEFLGRFE